jgi:hypothetical protein
VGWFLYENGAANKKNGPMIDALRTLSEEDRKVLSLLSENILCRTDWGYTLFGDKPMSSISVRNEWARREPLKHLIDLATPLLKRYGHVLHDRNFVVHIERSPEVTTYYLINKKSFLQTVQKNIDLFRNWHKKELTPRQLFDLARDDTSIFEDICKKSQALFGILFGYGTQNALTFERRAQIFDYMESQGTPPWKMDLDEKTLSPEQLLNFKSRQKKCFRQPKKIVPAEGFLSLEDEIDMLQAKLKSQFSFNAQDGLVFPVFFVGDPESQETKELIEKYERDRHLLTKIVVGGNALVLCKVSFCSFF